jgi:tetratricopeptide (TPR) repeat protein
MKITTIITAMCLMTLSLTIHAQDKRAEEIVTLLKNKEYNKAKQLADDLVKEEERGKNAKVWFYRALVYHNVYELFPQTEKESIKKAYESYMQALIYDKDKHLNNEIIKALGILANQFVYEGVELFNAGSYTQALDYFEKNMEIGRLPAYNQIDTVIMYNAALAAEKSGDLNKAVLYFEELTRMHFGGVPVYEDLAKVYKKQENEKKFLICIETGIRSYPQESFSLYSELINYYLEKGKYDLAEEHNLKALKQFPESAGLHFINASLNESKGKTEVAENEYKKTVELDPKFTDAYFNLGSLYYNKGVDLLKKAMNKDEKNKADDFYRKALAMYEEVHKLTPENQETIQILSNLYGYLGMPDKQKAMQEKLK